MYTFGALRRRSNFSCQPGGVYDILNLQTEGVAYGTLIVPTICIVRTGIIPRCGRHGSESCSETLLCAYFARGEGLAFLYEVFKCFT